MASDPEDQSVNPGNSEVVLNCVAFFYEEGKGGGKLQEKKQVPLFGKARGEEAGKIQGNRLVSTIFLYLILSYLKSTSTIDIILSFSPLKKNTDSYRTLSFMSFTERLPNINWAF